MSAQLVCPAGHYCEQTGTASDDGPSVPTPCPRGTYRSLEGGSTSTDCASCPAGKACTAVGTSSVTVDCAAGYVCVGGSDTVTPEAENYANPGSVVNGLCPKGFSCTAGTLNPQQCNAGQHNPSLG